jgi:hypothetical protein
MTMTASMAMVNQPYAFVPSGHDHNGRDFGRCIDVVPAGRQISQDNHCNQSGDDGCGNRAIPGGGECARQPCGSTNECEGANPTQVRMRARSMTGPLALNANGRATESRNDDTECRKKITHQPQSLGWMVSTP